MIGVAKGLVDRRFLDCVDSLLLSPLDPGPIGAIKKPPPCGEGGLTIVGDESVDQSRSGIASVGSA